MNIKELFGYPEISFEISERGFDAAKFREFVDAVEAEYPGYRFNRTESRYESCVMAIFERD